MHERGPKGALNEPSGALEVHERCTFLTPPLPNARPTWALSAPADGQRLAEGGQLPQISRKRPVAQCEHNDDFGIIGVDFPSLAQGELPLRLRGVLLARGEVFAERGGLRGAQRRLLGSCPHDQLGLQGQAPVAQPGQDMTGQGRT